MPRRDYDEDDEDDDLPEGVYDDDEDDGEPTVKCPYCGHEILETAQYCPKCENYISKEETPRESKSNFWIVMMVLAFLAAIAWVIG